MGGSFAEVILWGFEEKQAGGSLFGVGTPCFCDLKTDSKSTTINFRGPGKKSHTHVGNGVSFL